MKRKPPSQRQLAEHRRMIKAIGKDRLVALTELTPEAIHWWTKTGIPRAWRGTVQNWAEAERR